LRILPSFYDNSTRHESQHSLTIFRFNVALPSSVCHKRESRESPRRGQRTQGRARRRANMEAAGVVDLLPPPAKVAYAMAVKLTPEIVAAIRGQCAVPLLFAEGCRRPHLTHTPPQETARCPSASLATTTP
jgi:hypothetical protein